ncbi:glycoside hydrolase [Thozetella sp. PMI_491]|nr:glycoside hydrolase [Thozetella sp. PMI_491]
MKAAAVANLVGIAYLGRGVVAFQYPDCAHGPLANTTVCDTKASPSARAAALVKALNITEKLNNLIDSSLGAPRVGLPPYEWWSEALHGVAASPGVAFNRTGNTYGYATSFANPITMSAAFDDDLIYEIASVVSTEARAFSNAGLAGLDFWTPNINPYKDPRWGRGSETPGEDPLRIKGYVRALLAGLEGNQPTRKVIATCKHYAAYDLERWSGITRYRFDAIVSSQDLSEYYLPPFQQCARDSNVGSIMCSYNSLNGTPACASTYLMTDILRDHWGWKADNNYVTSDCNAIQNFLPKDHNYTATAAQAAAVAYAAGTDTVCEAAGFPPYTDVQGAWNQTLLNESVIDTALKRLYEGLTRAGYFDPPTSAYRDIGWKDNDGTLPLDVRNKTIALIGHWAKATRQMLGGYSGIPPFFNNPVAAAEARNLTYIYANGPVAQNDSMSGDWWTRDALDAARKADLVFYFGGTDLSIESEDRDRYSIAWPEAQLSLVQKLAELGKPLVVAELGSMIDDSPLLANKNISAIIWAGFPGQEGGTAVLDIITGKTAPAGRLPVTQYPSNYTNQVPLTDMNLRPVGGSPGRTYRWYKSSVLPFGHGLHYTKFNLSIENFPSSHSISGLLGVCKNKHIDLCAFPAVPVQVTNTGNRTSDFVALGFLAGEYGPKPYPIKTLASYKRFKAVKPGETARDLLPLTLGALARVDLAGNTVLYPGTYRLLLDVPTATEAVFTLTGNETVLDQFPQPK